MAPRLIFIHVCALRIAAPPTSHIDLLTGTLLGSVSTYHFHS